MIKVFILIQIYVHCLIIILKYMNNIIFNLFLNNLYRMNFLLILKLFMYYYF